MSMPRLKDMVAVVTGAALGIGRACAVQMAREGAAVAVLDTDAEAGEAVAREICSQGGNASFWRCDVSKERQVADAIGEAAARFGRINVLVNNAGISGPNKPTHELTEEEWDRVQAINVKGVFFCTKYVIPHMRAAGGGSIINLSSIAGRFGFPLRTPYAAAKWAVVGFTQSLAAEAGPDKVRVNCIQPGIVEGERVDRIIAAKAEQLGVPSSEILARMVEGISLKTTVTAQDVANTALFLASEAGKHISGQAISVCGGARYLV
jgi:NAD(P)-dependent dehydrogenase (short-subunit alcohol dehydrogenase family)